MRWQVFAKENGYFRAARKRAFDPGIEFFEILREEEVSLFKFCRSQNNSLGEKLTKLISGPPTREGFEHKVFFHLEDELPRVTKATLPGKYGRWEHTPYLYLERLALMNELVPSVDIRFEDCIEADQGYSIISSMAFFSGPAPSGGEVDKFLRDLDFESYAGSLTLDYINVTSGLVLRDCHPGNWVENKGVLIPIDVVPERIVPVERR